MTLPSTENHGVGGRGRRIRQRVVRGLFASAWRWVRWLVESYLGQMISAVLFIGLPIIMLIFFDEEPPKKEDATIDWGRWCCSPP